MDSLKHSLIPGILLIVLAAFQNAFAAPTIETWRTDNGARVLFVEVGDLPILDVRVIFDAGSARDGALPGLAAITNGLLVDGAGDWDADQIAERLESVGSEMSAGSRRDMAWVSARTLTEKTPLETTMETLSVILGNPRFDLKDLERSRQTMQVALKLEQQNPGKIASRRFYEALYGNHPYGIHSGGTAESLAAIERADVFGHYRRFYVANNAVIVLVGKIERSVAVDLSNRIASGMAAGEHAPGLPPVPPRADQDTLFEQFPSTQTHILMGQPGITRGDPDYFPLVVGNHLLGGSGLVSILSDEVREKRGLSYSVYSYFSPMRQEGPFIVGAQTQNARRDEAVSVLIETLRTFVEEGPDEAELEAAKKNITGGFPLRISSNKKIAEYLGMIAFYDLPLDYLDTYVKRVEEVSAEDVRLAFKRRVDPEKFLSVVVGNGAAIDEQR